MEVYLSLGSDMGDRAGYIHGAVERLDERLGKHFTALSDLVETESWGFDGPAFLNAAVRYDLDIDEKNVEKEGLRLLDICKDIERELGRSGEPEYDSEGNRIYRSRTVDIDILLMGNCIVDNPRLKVPHPLMDRREFVMVPLRQIKDGNK